MPLRLPRVLVTPLVLVAALLLQGCGDDPPPTGGAALAVITLTVANNPITQIETSGSTFVVRTKATIKESNGLGGTIERVEYRLYDDATGVVIAANVFDDKDLLVFVGSNRVESKSSLDIPIELSYVNATKRLAYLTVSIRLKDDKGNNIEQSLLVKAV